MTTKPVFEIGGVRFETLEGFYHEGGRVLLDECGRATWGRNLDAFNDVLRGGFGTPEQGGFVLRWLNAALSRQRLGYAETARQLGRRLRCCHPSNREVVAAELAAARDRRGPTMFDWLCEIIREHGDGGGESEDGVELVLA